MKLPRAGYVPSSEPARSTGPTLSRDGSPAAPESEGWQEVQRRSKERVTSPAPRVEVASGTSAFSTRLRTLANGNRFAPLGDEAGVERALAARGAARASPRGYTMPKIDLFGTDVPAHLDASVALGRALAAGYRGFDCASAYDSLSAPETGGSGR